MKNKMEVTKRAAAGPRVRTAFLLLGACTSACGRATPPTAEDLKEPRTWIVSSRWSADQRLVMESPISIYSETPVGCFNYSVEFARPYDPAQRRTDNRTFLEFMAGGDSGLDRTPPPKGPLVGFTNIVRADPLYGGRRYSLWSGYNRCNSPLQQVRAKSRSEIEFRFTNDPADLKDPRLSKADGLSIIYKDDDTKPYCRIDLRINGNYIKSSRIIILSKARDVPPRSNLQVQECLARGGFASLGYLGVLNFPKNLILQLPPSHKHPWVTYENGHALSELFNLFGQVAWKRN